MVFSSLEFLFLFLPLTLIIYFILPMHLRNIGLFVLSLVFYGYGEIRYIALMIFTLVFNYVCTYFIWASGDGKRRRAILVFTVSVNILLLAFFKYSDFIIGELARLPLFSGLTPPSLTLPIGISFYTFQSLSYVVDVYRNDAPFRKNFIYFGTYVTLFPQLIAGPIVKYREIDGQLDGRTHSAAMCIAGVRCFCAGLAKKVLLGNTAGAMWKNILALPEESRTVLCAWGGIVCFSLQIYFDFSGYSDMAIGLGRIFGFRFPENFNYPYTANSATDFWRRWHITLSSFFREYVYIPLGGNRRGKARTYLNLLVVWACTGLWHGASWNFLLWGLYWFLLIAAEKMFLGRLLEKIPTVARHAYAFLTIAFGWLIFAFDGSSPELSASRGIIFLKNMLGMTGASLVSRADTYAFLRTLPFFVCAAVACTPVAKKIFYARYGRGVLFDALTALICPVCVIVCTAFLVGSSYNPFLYFRF